MITREFNKGIAGFTCPTNFNGQVSLMFDETIDIDKIN